ncbi:MAG TPA: pilus assembly protein TadG-related protein [Gemmatimonadaceae bacterium]|nr:pilus assembly protein TadG-related protein [Gemmatimonadaceae bacterium]
MRGIRGFGWGTRALSQRRRGATLVMVTLMLVGLLGVGAIAADIGRFYAVVTELQTSADAAALAGALQLQKNSSSNAGFDVDSAVINFVQSTNLANGQAPIIDTNDVRIGFYTPPSRPSKSPLDFDLSGRHANAVSVVVSARPTGFFAQLLGRTGALSLSDTAVAWVANLGPACVRPWAFPYSTLYGAVTGIVGVLSPAPDLRAGDLVQYMRSHAAAAQRTFIIQPPQTTLTGAANGTWDGFNLTGASGRPNFVDALQGCRPPTSLDVETVRGYTDPADALNYPTWTTADIQRICQQRPSDADCYPINSTSSVAGVPVQIAWSDASTGTAVKFRFAGEFLLTCYFTSSTDSCGAIGPPQSGYPEGTIVGVLTAIKSRDLVAGDVLNDTPSNVQRIVLIR